MIQDIRYAVRSLRASPVFTIVALLVLTLGIGAGTAVGALLFASGLTAAYVPARRAARVDPLVALRD